MKDIVAIEPKRIKEEKSKERMAKDNNKRGAERDNYAVRNWQEVKVKTDDRVQT